MFFRFNFWFRFWCHCCCCLSLLLLLLVVAGVLRLPLLTPLLLLLLLSLLHLSLQDYTMGSPNIWKAEADAAIQAQLYALFAPRVPAFQLVKTAPSAAATVQNDIRVIVSSASHPGKLCGGTRNKPTRPAPPSPISPVT